MSAAKHAQRSPSEVFTALVDCIETGHWSDAARLYADDVTVTNPFESPTPKHGRASVKHVFDSLASRIASLQVADTVVHETTDHEVIIAEFRFTGSTHDHTRFEMPGLFVLRVRDGQIIEARDYLGPQQPSPGDAPR